MNSNGIALSIIIPTYNCGAFFEATLKQLLAARPGNCEIILSDDGSTDNTRAILASYEGKYDNLTVIYNDHSGVSGARNAGLRVARGQYVTLLDCDDCLHSGFRLQEWLEFPGDADLYIFSIDRICIDGHSEPLIVADRTYPDASAFADEYVRTHKLLLYSAGNKFYRRSIIERLGLQFQQGLQFGEDRLFNYQYLTGCGRIISSSDIMIDYIQRSLFSLSTCPVPHYFDNAIRLHQAKMDYILGLSKGTSERERREYIAYDLTNEIRNAVDHFRLAPEEKEETLAAINKLAFMPDTPPEPLDTIIVLGSRNCGYKAARALEIGSQYPGCNYIVSGGNAHMDGIHTESEVMADYLLKQGVPSDRVFMENESNSTRQNFTNSIKIVNMLRLQNPGAARHAIGIVSSGFHMPRIKTMVESMPEFKDERICYISAYGANTQLDNWFDNDYGMYLVLSEFTKRIVDLNEQII